MEKNDLVKFRSECISAHNFYRSLHATTPLIWSSKLADGAQRWAEELSSADSLSYSHERGVGENIACLWGSDVTGNKVTQIWYEEAKHYDYGVPRVTPITRPFCQVIWEGSRELGAGKSTTKNGKQIVVARYNPPASRRNAERNVKKPRLDRVDGDSSLVPHSLGLRKFQEECLFAHNEFRVLHGSPPLHWSPSLAWAAQQWAEELVRMGELKHNDDEMVGENLAGMVGDELTGKECTDMWYDEVTEYDYDSPGYSEDTSNFTQVVWIGSELFGVGRATHGDLCVVVAFYEPPGNIEGLFADNVRKAGTRVKSYRLIKETKTFIPPSPDLDWFRVECLVAHNYFRARHGAPPLVIAHGLNEEAQYWAERLLVTGATEDLQESRIGINVAVIEGQHVSGLKVTELWYQESTSYDFESPGFNVHTRSFTQLLWLTSRKLGVGKACNDNGQCVVVARYEPVGNIDGLFVHNVRRRGHERSGIEPFLFEGDVKYRIKVDGRRSIRMSWEIEGAMLQAENKHHDQTRLVWIESPVLPRRRMRPESSDLEKEDDDKSDDDKESGVEEGDEFDNEGTEPEPKEGTVLSRVAYFEQFEKMGGKPKLSSVELKPEVKKTQEHEETVCQLEYDDVFPKHDEHDERDEDFASEEEADDDEDDGMSLETVSEADEDLLGELDEFEMDHHITSYCYEDNYVRDQDEDNVVDEAKIEEDTERRDSSPDHCRAVFVKREEAAEEHLKQVDHLFEFIPRKDEKQHKDVDLNSVDLDTERECLKIETASDQPGRYSGPVCVEEVQETHREKPENALNLNEIVTRYEEAEKPKPKPPPTLPKPKRNKRETKIETLETNTGTDTQKNTETAPKMEEEVSTAEQNETTEKETTYTQETTESVPFKMEEQVSTIKQNKEVPNKTDAQETTESVLEKEDEGSTVVEQKEEVSKETYTHEIVDTVFENKEGISTVIKQKEVSKETNTNETTETLSYKVEEEILTVKQKEELLKEVYTEQTTETVLEKEKDVSTGKQKEEVPKEISAQGTTETVFEKEEEVSAVVEQKKEVSKETYIQEITDTVLKKDDEVSTIKLHEEVPNKTDTQETTESALEKEDDVSTVVQQKEEVSKETYLQETTQIVFEKEVLTKNQKEDVPKETYKRETTETAFEKEEVLTVEQREVPKERYTQETTKTGLDKLEKVSTVEQKEEVPKDSYTQETTEPVAAKTEETFPTVVEEKEEIPKETELNTSNEEEETLEVSDGEDTIEVIDIAHIDRDRRVNRILNRLGRHIGLIPLEQSPKKGEISKDIDLSDTEHEKAIFSLFTPSFDKRSWSASPVEEEMISAEEKFKVESEIPWDELFKDEDESLEKEDEKEALGTVKRHMLQEKRRSVSFKETVIVQEHEAFREEPLQDEYCEEESEEDLKTYNDEFDVGETKPEGVEEVPASSPVFLSHKLESEETMEVVSNVRDSEDESAGAFEEEGALTVETATTEDTAQSIHLSEDISEEEDEYDVDKQQTEDSIADVYEEYERSHANLIDSNYSSQSIHVAAELESKEPIETNSLEEKSVRSTMYDSFEEVVPGSSSTEVVVPSSCHVPAEIEIHASEARAAKEVEIESLPDEEPECGETVEVRGITDSSVSTVCITTETTYHKSTEMKHKCAPSIDAEVCVEEEKQTQKSSDAKVVPNGHCTSYITPDDEDIALEATVEFEKEPYQEETPEKLDEHEMKVQDVERQKNNEELSDEEPVEDELVNNSQAFNVCSSHVFETDEKTEEEETVEEQSDKDVVIITKDNTKSSFVTITQEESESVVESETVLGYQAEEVEEVEEEEEEPKAGEDVKSDNIIERQIEDLDKEEDEGTDEPVEQEEQKATDVRQEQQVRHTKEICESVNDSHTETKQETIELEDGGFVSKTVTRNETSTVEEDNDDDSSLTKKIITRTVISTTTTSLTFTNDEPSGLTEGVEDFIKEKEVKDEESTEVERTEEQEVKPSFKEMEDDGVLEDTLVENIVIPDLEKQHNLEETVEASRQVELEHEQLEEEVTDENARKSVDETTYERTENRVVEVGRSDNFYFNEKESKEPKPLNKQHNLETSRVDINLEDKVQDVQQFSEEEENPLQEQVDEIYDEKIDKSTKEEGEHFLQPRFSDDRFGYISEEELEETEELYVALRESSEKQEYEEKLNVGVMHMANHEDEKFEPSEDDIAYDSEVVTEVEKEITSALVIKESFSSPICDDENNKDTAEEDNPQEHQSDPLQPLQFVDVEKSEDSLDKDEGVMEESPDVMEESEDVESSDENVTEKVQLVQFTEDTEVKENTGYEQQEEQKNISPAHSFEEENDEEEEDEEEEEELESSGELMENVELIQFSEKDDDKVDEISTEPFERASSPPPSDDEEKELDSSEENIEENVELIQFSEQDTQNNIDEEEKDVGSSEDLEDESVELIQFSETSGQEKIVEFDSKEEFVEESEVKSVQLIQFTEQDEDVVIESDKEDAEIIRVDASEQVESSPPLEISEGTKSEEDATQEESVPIHFSEEQIEIEEHITKKEKYVAPCIPIVLTELCNTDQQQQEEETELHMIKDTKDRDFISIVDAPLACSTPIDVAEAKSDDTFDDSGEAGFGEGFDVIDRIIAHDDLDELQRSSEVSHDDSFQYIEAEETATKAVAESEDLDDSRQSPTHQVVEENITETEQDKSELVDLSLFESERHKEVDGKGSQDHVSPPPAIFATEFVAEEEEDGSEEEYIPNFDHPRIYMVEEKELVIDPSIELQTSDTVDSSFRTEVTADTDYPSEISTASELSQAIDHDQAQDEIQASQSTIVHSQSSDLDDLEEEDKERVYKRQEEMEEVFLQEEIDIQSSHQEGEKQESDVRETRREERISHVSYATSVSTLITRQETPKEQSYREEQATFIMQEDEQLLLEKEPRQEDITADEAVTEDDFRSDGHSSKTDESFEDIDGMREESKTIVEDVYLEELDVSKLEPTFKKEASETQESGPINVDIAFTEEVEVERVPEVEEPPKILDDDEVLQDDGEKDVYQEEVEIQRVKDYTDDVFEEEVEIKRMKEPETHEEAHHIPEKTNIAAVYEEELEIVAERKQDNVESIEENDGIVLAEPIQSDSDNTDEEREHNLDEDIVSAEQVQREAEENDSPESDQQGVLEEFEIEEEDGLIPHEIQGINEQDNIYDNNNNQPMTRYYVDYSPGDSFERDSTASDDPELYRQGEPMEEDMEEFILVKYGSEQSHSDSSDEDDLSDHREMYVIPEEESEDRVQQEPEVKEEPDETVFYEQGFMNPALEDINEEEEDDDKDKSSPKDDEDDIEEKRQLEEYERLESFVMLEEKLSQVESDESMEDLTSGTGEKRSSSEETLNEDDELADTTNTSSTLKDEVASKVGSGDESSGELEKTLTTEEEEIIDLEDGGVLSKRTTREESYSVEEMNDSSDGDDDKDRTLTRKRISKKVVTTTTTSATHVTKVPSEEHQSGSDEESTVVKENVVIEVMPPSQEAFKDYNTHEQTKPENTSSIEREKETIELDDGGVVSKIVTREETCTYDDDDDHDDGDSSVTKKTKTRKVVTTTTTTTSKSTPLSEPVLCLTEGDENSNKIKGDTSSETHETVIKSRQNGEDMTDQSAKRQLSREGSFAEACVEPLRKRRGFSLDSHDSEEHSSPTDSTGESTGRSNEDLLSADEDYSGLDDFQRDCIVKHNIYRHQHRACRLVWSDELSKASETWAEHLATTNSLEHASDKEQGENLASAKGYDLTGDKVAEMWYEEVKDYNFETPAFNAKCGHFTQMIWRDTKQFGVAKSTAADGTQYVVARYHPAGNVLGEFKTSIRRARGQRSSVRKRRRSSARRRSSQTDSGDIITQQEKFKNECVVSHNYYRSLHGAQPLQWSTRLAIESQNFAEKLVRSGSFMHSGDKEIGECLAFSFGLELSGRDAVDSWYDEIVDYDYEFPGFTSHTGNFTQLIWQGTKEFGMGKAVGEDGSCVVVGRYYPPGNQVGNFQENVKQKQPGYF